MDDQALVEGSVVFKDEDDPAEESQLAEQGTVPGSCRGAACPTQELRALGLKMGSKTALPFY